MRMYKLLYIIAPVLLASPAVVGATTKPQSVHRDVAPQQTQQTQKSDGDNQATQTRQLSQPYVAIGTGANQQKLSELKDALGVTPDTKTITTNAQDTQQYTDVNVPDDQVVSSASIIPAQKGSGVNVKIVDFEGHQNITQITEPQYAMVAQMAGLQDVLITVTADRPISGHGALAGLYKALATDGIALSADNTTNANGMLDASQKAIDENSDDKQFPQKISGAILIASGEDKAPDQALSDGLKQADIPEDKLSDSSKQAIESQLSDFSKTPAAQSNDYKDTIKDTADNLTHGDYATKAQQSFKKLTGKDQNMIEQIINAYSRGLSQIKNIITVMYFNLKGGSNQ